MRGRFYEIDYSAVAGFSTPPSETFYLADGEDKSLTRSYSGASSLTVNVAPAAGQWRIDGGAWQTSGSIAFNLSLGAHNIEHAPLEGYIAPVSETVWFRQNQSLNLTRSYLPSTNAYLEVKILPAYLSEIGVAKWRVDGGNWNSAGKPVAVSPGTHTLEFQPVTGIEVPPASSLRRRESIRFARLTPSRAECHARRQDARIQNAKCVLPRGRHRSSCFP